MEMADGRFGRAAAVINVETPQEHPSSSPRAIAPPANGLHLHVSALDRFSQSPTTPTCGSHSRSPQPSLASRPSCAHPTSSTSTLTTLIRWVFEKRKGGVGVGVPVAHDLHLAVFDPSVLLLTRVPSSLARTSLPSSSCKWSRIFEDEPITDRSQLCSVRTRSASPLRCCSARRGKTLFHCR